MKKLLILFFLLYSCVYAFERESTLKLYHELFDSLTGKSTYVVYTDDNEYRDVFRYSSKITVTTNYVDADIVLISDAHILQKVKKSFSHQESAQKRGVLFVTDYHFLGECPLAIGAFYWRKGRFQLLFIKSRLKMYNIELPKKYQEYTIDTL